MKRYFLFLFLVVMAFCANAQCWKTVSAGYKYTIALKSDGTLWSWGSNSAGQLGDGTYVSRNIPVQVGTVNTWKNVCASEDADHANAIQTNGTLWGWGSNGFGQQGNGTVNPVMVPTQIGTDMDWKMVDGTRLSTIALKINGTLWAWGGRFLGNGNLSQSLVPIQVGTDTDWKTISVGRDHILAVKNNGSLWSWGSNICNQLGDGTSNDRLVPIQIGTDTDWQIANAAWYHSSAQKINGTLWTWGSNSDGEIGDGTLIYRSTPTLVTAVNNFQMVSLGMHFTMGVRTNGTLWAWGLNIFGELGNGSSSNIYTPAQSGNVTNWDMVDGGYDHTAGIKTDGTLWTWGSNMEGQMGTGNYWSNPGGSNVPKEVFSPNVITANATNTNVCSGTSVALTATGTATFYTWAGGVVNGASFIPSSTVIYTVTGYDIIGCSNTSTVEIVVNPITTVTANATSTLVCLGSGIGTMLIGSGGSFYTWSGTVLDGVAFTPQATGTYSVTDASGCSNTATIAISVSSTPTITGVSTQTSCVANTPMVITPSGASTYTLLPDNLTGTSFTVYPWVVTNTYTVIGINASGCSSTSLTSLQTTINVGSSPQVSIQSSTGGNSVCYGQALTLTAMGSANTYTWSGAIVSNSITISQTSAAVYTLTGTSSEGCAGDTASITIIVKAMPTILVNDTLICSGSSAVLSPTSNSASTTYSWSTGATINSITVSPLVTTSYTIAADLTGCKSSSVVTVSVSHSGIPVTGFSYSSPLCSTDNGQLPNTITNFSANGLFSSSPDLSINPNTGLIATGLSIAGFYVVTYSVSATNCTPASNSTATIVINNPIPATTSFSYASKLCIFGTASPNLITGFSGGGTFSSRTGVVMNPSTGLIDLVHSTPGTYTVNYNFNASNCVQSGTGTQVITIHQLPVISVSSDVTITSDENTTLNANSSTATYTWFPANNLSCTVCPNPVASPKETTVYCVKTTDGVCTNTACVKVNIETPCQADTDIYLPSAFSPNGDYNNDAFCVQGETKCVTDFKMMIYNRWGEKVFETTNHSFCWDGTYKGKVLEPEVFVYSVNVIFSSKKELNKKGNVTLLK